LKRILVVDDESALRRALARQLTEKGYFVYSAAGGLDAEKALDAQRFDLAVIDVNLGTGIDGVTLGLIMGAMQPDLKVALVSGDPARLKQACDAGFKHVFAKPLRANDLDFLLSTC
jgi:DNA-binding NtrC family response regulator